jgi:hypothetical protein
MSFQQYQQAMTLDTVGDALRELYLPGLAEHVWRAGQVTNRLFRPSSDGVTVTGDGLTIQVQTGMNDSARASRNMLKDFGNSRHLTVSKIKLRAETDPNEAASGNDFLRTEAVAQITELERQRGNDPGVALNLAEREYNGMRDSYDFSKPVMYYSTAEGKFAAVNGTPKDNDADNYAGAGSYSSGATSFRVPVDFGSVSAFKPNTHWDFYTGDTLLADEVRVTDFNPFDLSVGFELTDASTVANCDAVVDNADIYRSGEKGNGFRGSLRAWFDEASSGENFLGGVDRTTSAYRWLKTQRYKATASGTVKINRDQLDALALGMGYVDDGMDMGQLVLSSTSIIQTLRKSIGEEALSNQAANNDGNYSFGQNVLSYIHPTFGKVVLQADPLHPNDRMHFLRAADWQLIPYLNPGLNILDEAGNGGWYREGAASGGGGRGMYWRMDAYDICTLWCKLPQKQGVILNINA